VQTIQTLARELSAALVHGKRTDGSEYVFLGDAPKHQWMRDVIRTVHGDKLPDDTTYKFIERCADAIAEADQGTEPMDSIYEIESDIYTHELTAWLHARADHLAYVDEVIEEIGRACIGSASDLLMAAQAKQIQEVGSALVSELEKLVEVKQ